MVGAIILLAFFCLLGFLSYKDSKKRSEDAKALQKWRKDVLQELKSITDKVSL